MKLRSSLASLAIGAVVLAAAAEANATCPNPLPLSQANATTAINNKLTSFSTQLGTATSNLINPTDWGCSGWFKTFTNGGIWVSAETAAHVLLDEIAVKFLGGSLLDELGYPMTDHFATSGGEAVTFGFGTIYHRGTLTSANVMDSSIFSQWANRLIGKDGALGFPSGDRVAVTGGFKNSFDHGFMIHDGAGTRAVLQGAFDQSVGWSVNNCPEFIEEIANTDAEATRGKGHVTVHCFGDGRVDFYLNTASGSTFIGYTWSLGNTGDFDTGWINNSQAGHCNGSTCFATIEARSYVNGVARTSAVASFKLNP